MKRWICFLGVVWSFFLCTVCVNADVIWEPMDSFYEEHASECTYVNRQYVANGPDGVVILYESPESAKEVTRWENGRQVYISFIYEDERGILWGISESDQTGWMPMDYMRVVYDHISFEEDYGDQIVNEEGVLDERYRNETVCFWDYPGAETYSSVNLQDCEHLPEYGSVYTDETGHRWGYIGYYYGFRSVWVCIDEPAADREALYPDGAPQIGKEDMGLQGEENGDTRDESQKSGNGERIVPQTNHRVAVVVTVLVLLVVLVTAVLLIVLKKRG